MRSSTPKSPALPGLTSTATTSSSYRAAARLMTSTCPLVTGSPDSGEIRLEHGQHRRAGFDEDDAFRAAREGLEPERARPGIEIQDRGAAQVEQGAERVEQRLAGPVAGRADPGGRHLEPP